MGYSEEWHDVPQGLQQNRDQDFQAGCHAPPAYFFEHINRSKIIKVKISYFLVIPITKILANDGQVNLAEKVLRG